MSIAAQCPDCCTCPTATVEWDSRSASKTKCGTSFNGINGIVSNKRWRVLTPSLAAVGASVAGQSTYSDGGGPCIISSNVTVAGYCGAGSVSAGVYVASPGGGIGYPGMTYVCGFSTFVPSYNNDVVTTESSLAGTNTISHPGRMTLSLSDEYTTAELISGTVAALPAYDNDWSGTAGSFANLSTNELTYSIRESRYRLRFKIPQVLTGKCYRLSWVERFIPEAGTTITGVDVFARGVYRPEVTLSAPPFGGTQAFAVAVMSSTGTVSSIRILNPGSGYTTAPSVEVGESFGGTSSTGWTATLTNGQVTGITGGSPGDYRPTLAFSAPGGGGATATATCTVDETGGIDAVTITNAGSLYTYEPTLSITPKVSGATDADLLIRMGTETAKCVVWDGTVPSGYDPDTPSTYPILPGSGYYELAVPTSDGTTLVANLRAVCDGSACP